MKADKQAIVATLRELAGMADAITSDEAYRRWVDAAKTTLEYAFDKEHLACKRLRACTAMPCIRVIGVSEAQAERDRRDDERLRLAQVPEIRECLTQIADEIERFMVGEKPPAEKAGLWQRLRDVVESVTSGAAKGTLDHFDKT